MNPYIPPLKRTPDAVEHPAHYTRGKIEVVDFIEDQQLDYQLGTMIAYLVRSPHKGQELIDLKKARFYLNRRIAQKEAELAHL
jgi:hypothetical protein